MIDLKKTDNSFFWACILFLISIFLYINTFNFGYVLDDGPIIRDNAYVKEGITGIPELLKSDVWANSNLKLGYYRPLPSITFALEHEIFGSNPKISHLLNVLLYGLSAILLFFLVRIIFPQLSGVKAFLITAFFVVHPLHTEVVANLKSRDEILSFLFVILSLYSFVKHFNSKKLLSLLSSLIFFYLALLSKETSVILILFLPLVIYFLSQKKSFKPLAFLLPFVFFFSLFLLQKHLALGPNSFQLPDEIINYPYRDWEIKIPTLLYLVYYSIRLNLFPYPLRYDYSYNQIPEKDWTNPIVLFTLLAMITGLFFIVHSIYKNKKESHLFSLLLFFISLAPLAGFVILRGGIFAERIIYISVFPFFAFLLLAIDNYLTNKSKLVNQLKYLIIIAILITFSVLTFNRNFVWKDDLVLFQTDGKHGWNCSQNMRHLGSELIHVASKESNITKRTAISNQGLNYLQRAVQLVPSFGEAYLGIGIYYTAIKPNSDSAIYYFRKSVEVSPGLARGYFNLAVTYQNLNDFASASYFYTMALRYKPDYKEASEQKEFIKKSNGIDVQVDPSSVGLDTTCIGKPKSDCLFNQGNYWASRGDYAKALIFFEKAYQLDITNISYGMNLSNCLGMLNRYTDAIKIGLQLASMSPNNPIIFENLAICYKFSGDSAKFYHNLAIAQKIRLNQNK